jgi:hypothetical protein
MAVLLSMANDKGEILMHNPSPDRTPQQDPQQPENDPGQVNPKIPGIDNPSDKPRPASDPGKQPIA